VVDFAKFFMQPLAHTYLWPLTEMLLLHAAANAAQQQQAVERKGIRRLRLGYGTTGT
jgi:hypothetical protein